MLWFRSIERLPTTLMPIIGLLSPVMAISLGFFVLHQSLTGLQIGGVALILTSIVASQRLAIRPPSHVSTATPGTPTQPGWRARVPTSTSDGRLGE